MRGVGYRRLAVQRGTMVLLPWHACWWRPWQGLCFSCVMAWTRVRRSAWRLSARLRQQAGWLAWATFRVTARAGAEAPSADLRTLADQLAKAVDAQWKAEAAIRRLNDPYPIPVSWSAAEASLADSWDTLVTVASSGAGWPTPTSDDQARWAAGPDGLAGTGNQLEDILDRVPTRRLVVLGEPGSGKTMLLVRLLLDMYAGRAPGSPVPVFTSIASWNPAGQDLWEWFSAQLLIDHPGLAVVAPGGEGTLAQALLTAGLILPLLDGLDEIQRPFLRRTPAQRGHSE
jgi:NACHT domain